MKVNSTKLFIMEKHIDDLLVTFGLTNRMSPTLRLSTEQCPKTEIERAEMKKFPFQSLVGVLMYLMLCVRPVARFSANPGRAHWDAAVTIVRYLKGTKSLGISFTSGLPSLCHEAYADSDWANADIDTRRSQTGNLEMMSHGPIFWRSRPQKSVALSSTEAEYVSCTDMAKAVVPTRSTLIELGMQTADADPTVIYQDNESTMRLAMYSTLHERTRHIDIRRHFIRELIAAFVIATAKKASADMSADALTKPLALAPLVRCRDVMMGNHMPAI